MKVTLELVFEMAEDFAVSLIPSNPAQVYGPRIQNIKPERALKILLDHDLSEAYACRISRGETAAEIRLRRVAERLDSEFA